MKITPNTPLIGYGGKQPVNKRAGIAGKNEH